MKANLKVTSCTAYTVHCTCTIGGRLIQIEKFQVYQEGGGTGKGQLTIIYNSLVLYMYVFLYECLEIQGVETARLRNAYNLDYYDHTCTSFIL